MAAKKEEKKLERVYNVPLRKEWLKAPKYKRAKKAARALREFIIKNMKSDDVKIGKYANELLWARGIKSPPHHIKVNAVKDEKGVVTVELVGAPVKENTQKSKISGVPETKGFREIDKKVAKIEKTTEKKGKAAKEAGKTEEKPAEIVEEKEAEIQ